MVVSINLAQTPEFGTHWHQGVAFSPRVYPICPVAAGKRLGGTTLHESGVLFRKPGPAETEHKEFRQPPESAALVAAESMSVQDAREPMIIHCSGAPNITW
jgi:hypothetical protein